MDLTVALTRAVGGREETSDGLTTVDMDVMRKAS
jgi:hypothetical protein